MVRWFGGCGGSVVRWFGGSVVRWFGVVRVRWSVASVVRRAPSGGAPPHHFSGSLQDATKRQHAAPLHRSTGRVAAYPLPSPTGATNERAALLRAARLPPHRRRRERWTTCSFSWRSRRSTGSATLRDVLWVVTAFTVGHSITLALAVTGMLELSVGAHRVPDPRDDRDHRDREHRGERPDARAVGRPVSTGVRRRVRAGARRGVRELPRGAVRRADRRRRCSASTSASKPDSSSCSPLAAVALTPRRWHAGEPSTTERWPAVRLRAVAVSLLVVAVASLWAAERAPW